MEKTQLYPRHVAIIMDGNGRWAQKRLLPRKAGHAVGSETFRTIAEYLNKNTGVEYLTVYAFSTENWSRPKDEVDEIMRLLRKYMDEACSSLLEKNIRLHFLGDLTIFPDDIRSEMERLHALSEKTTGLYVNVAVNYGSRDEIVHAVRALAASGADMTKITEEDIAAHLYTAGQPDPDLIIRTGAEKRLSNFLLWQGSYAELYFTEVLWPDFSPKEIEEALTWFRGRKRRYGNV
ncbi:MAG: di-trans,poly-cis-decaprenylcistransferase [Clostridia bacterium]|nr:di-trans,poly-cis-decaprenylcistransferase [Clostridia bacterium]